MSLGIVYGITSISRPGVNDNRVVSEDEATSSSSGGSSQTDSASCSGVEEGDDKATWEGTRNSSLSSSGSSSSEASTIMYADGSYVKTSKTQSSSNTSSSSGGSFIVTVFDEAQGNLTFDLTEQCGLSPASSSCQSSSSSEFRETLDLPYSDTEVESVLKVSSKSSDSSSCSGSGGNSSDYTLSERYYNIGIETVKVGAAEIYNLTAMHSMGRTDSPNPCTKDCSFLKGPIHFKGAFGVVPEFLYATTATTQYFTDDASTTTSTKLTHYILDKSTTYTQVSTSNTQASISYTLPSFVPTSWRNYRPINPGTSNYVAFMTPEKYATNGIALFFATAPTKGHYLAAKNTDWRTSFSVSQVGIEAKEGVPPNNLGTRMVTYDELSTTNELSNSVVFSSFDAFPGRAFSSSNTGGPADGLSVQETTITHLTGFQFGTDANGYYSSTCVINIPTTQMTTESLFNQFSSQTIGMRKLFDSVAQTEWISPAYFPSFTTSTNTNTSDQGGGAYEEEDNCCNWSGVSNSSASGSSSGRTAGSTFPLPFIATPGVTLANYKPSPRHPLLLEDVAKGIGIPLTAPFGGASHNNTWARFDFLGVEDHARRYVPVDFYLENPGAYFIPYNGTVSGTGYSGHQAMSWDGSNTSVTLIYKLDGATKTQSKSSVISPSALGSIMRSVNWYATREYLSVESPPWLNASPGASNRRITYAEGNVMITKGEFSAITNAPPDGTPIMQYDAISPYLASFSKMTINQVGHGDPIPSTRFKAYIGHDSPASVDLLARNYLLP